MQSARLHRHHASKTHCSAIRRALTTHRQSRSYNAFTSKPQVPPKKGHSNGVFAGRAIAIKDNIVTKDLPTTAASRILEGYQSPFDATVVQLLRQHGAHISAKTNLDEFGMGSHSQHSASGAVYSPFSRNGEALSAGGSSGGSAVAVKTKQCWAALGTDTGGSVRLPAAYTGVVGFKPSYGRLSRWGVIQYANSLDTVGILANTVQDVESITKCLDVYDSKDPTSLSPSMRKRLASTSQTKPQQSLRIGVPLEYNIAELSPLVRKTYLSTLLALQSAGHTLHPISLPTTTLALSAYYVLAPAEASSNLAKYDGVRYGRRATPHGPDSSPFENLPLYARTRGVGFGEEVKRRILLGAYTLSSKAMDNYFIQAQRVRRLVQRDFDGVFGRGNPLLDVKDTSRGGEEVGKGKKGGESGVDVLITPTAPTLPPTLADVARQTPVEGYMNDVFTVPASLAGLPAVSVPVSITDADRKGMDGKDVDSVGIQVIGQFGDDNLVLHTAGLIEKWPIS